MPSDLSLAPTPPPAKPADDLGIDRAFLMQMARVPFIAVGFAALGLLGALASPDYGPVVVICLGMVLAAVIDGWAFKVPNWLTLPLVVSGWLLGLCADLGLGLGAFQGGVGSAVAGTAVGFACLFPALFIGGMGQGDVKMQMGFGSWVGAIYGAHEGLYIVLYAFCAGAIVGGVFGLVIMALRRQFHKNAKNFREILVDLQVMVTAGPAQAAQRANARRSSWVRLPYGVPLCVGFVGVLALRVWLGGGSVLNFF
jgi:prepilin peptidase CpaA